MSTPSQRLSELGLTLPDVAPPVAAYVPAMRVGTQVWTSGQLPFRAGSLPATGLVGAGTGQVDPAVAKELASTAILNAIAAVVSVIDAEASARGDAALGIDGISRILKVTGFVASDPSFTGQPAVINGASELLQQIFGDAGVHVRSAVGVASLPLGSPVEIELVAEVS